MCISPKDDEQQTNELKSSLSRVIQNEFFIDVVVSNNGIKTRYDLRILCAIFVLFGEIFTLCHYLCDLPMLC
jgi:hypothetical protein